MNYLIGIDLGTSATKTILTDDQGRILASASYAYPLKETNNGWAEQNPLDWKQAVLSTVKEVVVQSGIDGQRVRGIGLSGQMHGLVMLDEQGGLLRDSIIWCDQRAGREAAARFGGMQQRCKHHRKPGQYKRSGYDGNIRKNEGRKQRFFRRRYLRNYLLV